MLGTKEELGRGAFGEMYVYLQPAGGGKALLFHFA